MVELKKDKEIRVKLLEGVNEIAEAVKSTLGPKGRNVIIEELNGIPKITKDGVTVAKAFDELDDPFSNMAAQLIVGVADSANDESGDGTTTATVLTQAILQKGIKLVEAGYNPLEIRDGINKSVKAIVKELDSIALPLNNDYDLVKKVATISANNNGVIGQDIADVFKSVGEEGAVSIDLSKNSEVTKEVVSGLKFDRGMISSYFSSKSDQVIAEMIDPYILVADTKITEVKEVMTTLEPVVKSGRPLFIIAEDISGQALSMLIMNKTKGGIDVCAAKGPGFGEWRTAQLSDIAVLTGATLIQSHMDLEEIDMSYLGQASLVKCTQSTTTIVGGKGEHSDIINHASEIDKLISMTKDEYMKDKLKERKSKLVGGVGVIKVGAKSEVEAKELYDLYEDARCAVVAAMEEGIVPGGGIALLNCRNVKVDVDSNTHEALGVNVIIESIESPLRVICENANKSPDVVIDNISRNKSNKSYGYNAKDDKYEDMFDAGIIDPKKVTRVALENAASVAGTILTTQFGIVKKKNYAE